MAGRGNVKPRTGKRKREDAEDAGAWRGVVAAGASVSVSYTESTPMGDTSEARADAVTGVGSAPRMETADYEADLAEALQETLFLTNMGALVEDPEGRAGEKKGSAAFAEIERMTAEVDDFEELEGMIHALRLEKDDTALEAEAAAMRVSEEEEEVADDGWDGWGEAELWAEDIEMEETGEDEKAARARVAAAEERLQANKTAAAKAPSIPSLLKKPAWATFPGAPDYDLGPAEDCEPYDASWEPSNGECEIQPEDVRLKYVRKVPRHDENYQVVTSDQEGGDGRRWLVDQKRKYYVGVLDEENDGNGENYRYDPLTREPLKWTRNRIERTPFYKNHRKPILDAALAAGAEPLDEPYRSPSYVNDHFIGDAEDDDDYLLFFFSGFVDNVGKLATTGNKTSYSLALTGNDSWGRNVVVHVGYRPTIAVRVPSTWMQASDPNALRHLAAGLKEDLNTALLAKAKSAYWLRMKLDNTYNNWRPETTPACLDYRVKLGGRDLYGVPVPGESYDFIELELAHPAYVRAAAELLDKPDEPAVQAANRSFDSQGAPPANEAAARQKPGWYTAGPLPNERHRAEYAFKDMGTSDRAFHVYNTFDAETGFMITTNLPTNWLRVKRDRIRAVPEVERLSLFEGEYCCERVALEEAPPDVLERTAARIAGSSERRKGDAPLRHTTKIFFDIETDVPSNYVFGREHSRATTKVCCLVYDMDTRKEYRVTFSLGDVSGGQGVNVRTEKDAAGGHIGYVYVYHDERRMNTAITAFFLAVGAFAIVAYNAGFDWTYLVNRARVIGGCGLDTLSFFPALQPRWSFAITKSVSKFSATVPGMAVIDLFYPITQMFKLTDNRLGAVTEYFTGMGKADLAYWQMHAAQRTQLGRRRLAVYCMLDCVCMRAIEEATSVLRIYIEMSALTRNSFVQQTTRGVSTTFVQFFLVRALNNSTGLLERGQSGYWPTNSALGMYVRRIEGGYVFPPVKGLFMILCILMLDFKSLYPSGMKAWNPCPTSMVSMRITKLMNLIEERDFVRRPEIDPDWRGTGLTGRKPSQQPFGFIREAADEEGVVRGISVMSGTQTYLMDERVSYKRLMGAEGRRGRALEEKLSAILPKGTNEGSLTDDQRADVAALRTAIGESSVAEQRFNIQQMAMKLTGNSGYGVLLALFSAIRCVDAGDFVTACGRYAAMKLEDCLTYNFRLHNGETEEPDVITEQVPELASDVVTEEVIGTNTFASAHYGGGTNNQPITDALAGVITSPVLPNISKATIIRIPGRYKSAYGDTDSVMVTLQTEEISTVVIDPTINEATVCWKTAPRAVVQSMASAFSIRTAELCNEYFDRPSAYMPDPETGVYIGNPQVGLGAPPNVLIVEPEKTYAGALLKEKKKYAMICILEGKEVKVAVMGLASTRRSCPPVLSVGQPALIWNILQGDWRGAVRLFEEQLDDIVNYRIPPYLLATSYALKKDASEYAKGFMFGRVALRHTERYGEVIPVGQRRLVCYVHSGDPDHISNKGPKSKIKAADLAELLSEVDLRRLVPHAPKYAEVLVKTYQILCLILKDPKKYFKTAVDAAFKRASEAGTSHIQERKIQLGVLRERGWGTIAERARIEAKATEKEDPSLLRGIARTHRVESITSFFKPKPRRFCDVCRSPADAKATAAFYGGATWRAAVAGHTIDLDKNPFARDSAPRNFCVACLEKREPVRLRDEAIVELKAAIAKRTKCYDQCRGCVKPQVDSDLLADLEEAYRNCTTLLCPNFSARDTADIEVARVSRRLCALEYETEPLPLATPEDRQARKERRRRLLAKKAALDVGHL